MDARKPGLLKRYFTGLAENTFHCRLGVTDPPLIEYVSDVLVRFVRSDRGYRVRNLKGRPLTGLFEMLVEAEARIGDARRQAHQYVGDFALFWTGVYPERLDKLSKQGAIDHLVDYCEQGKRAYRIASQISCDEEDHVPSDLLERLSDQFELCAFGLRQVREQWESREDGPAEGLLFN